MKIIKILAISIMAVMLFACSKYQALNPPRKHFIEAYIEPQEMFAPIVPIYSDSLKRLRINIFHKPFNPHGYDSLLVKDFYTRNKDYIHIPKLVTQEEALKTDPAAPLLNWELLWRDTGVDFSGRVYDELTKTNNDLNYNRRDSFGFAIAPDILNISVKCWQNFDGMHSAGELLNEYFYIGYRSAYEFIQSKYEKSVKIEYATSLYEFNLSPKKLLDCSYVLDLKNLPETAGDYTFTITYKDSKGKTLSVTTEPVTLPARG